MSLPGSALPPSLETVAETAGLRDPADACRLDLTPLTQWMNGISSYSMWWVIIHEDWYLHHGNLPCLKEQQSYLTNLLKRLTTCVGTDGKEKLDGVRYLDWPTFENKPSTKGSEP